MRYRAWQRGSKPWAWVLVALALLSTPDVQAADVTSQFAITRSGFVLNRTSNTFDQTVTLRNISAAAISPPVIVVVNGLPATIALANKAGQTPGGAPYVSPALPGGSLPSGSSLSFPLKFANPQRVAITSTLQVLNTIDLPPDAPTLVRVVATSSSTAFIAGRVVGASNLPLTLQATTSATCVDGVLTGGTPVGGVLAVTTDAAGYFGTSVTGVAPGTFVAINVVSPTVTATSTCLVSSRDNDSWPKAFPLDGSPASASDLIDVAGRARWYRFSVIPGQRIEVRLTGLPADYDVAVFKDIGQAFAKQFNPANAKTNDLLRLTAEYAPSVFSPSVFSPSVFSPDAFSPSVFSPSVFSPSVFSPSVFSPSVFSPSVFSPSVFSPSVFSPSVFSPSVFSPSVFSPSVFSSQELAQAFSTAQTRSVISVAATPGTSDEATVVNTWNNTGNFYLRVVGHNGAFDTRSPFTVSVVKGATSCTGVTDMAITTRTPVAASALNTVIVADSSRTPLDTPLNVPGGGTLRDKLTTFAKRADIAGVVVDIGVDARVRALKAQASSNAACPFAKNLVAQEIKGIIDSYRTNPLRYVVLVGNDDAIPFFRSPDESAIGLESGYVPPVESNSPSEASLRLDYVLSQDGYGSTTSLSLGAIDFPVPALAVGRLVETPNEIAGLIDAYVSAGGAIVPKNALVTGYDFLADAADAVRDHLQQAMGAAPDTLITPNGKSPQDPASWTATQLRQQLFGSRHDVIFLAGHFSANSALAADFATSVLTTELAASTIDFTNSVVFSAGCHSGYNLVDADAIAGVTQPLDWAQAFARKGATLIAGTGYQYGDTDFLEYSERIYANFARELRAGTGPVAVGEALVKAKLDYLNITPDVRGLHQKALLESALFGLPMLGVNMPAGRGGGGTTGPAVAASAIASGPAVSLGLKSFDLSVNPTLTTNTATLQSTQGGSEVVATWLSGPDGVVTKPGEPALPLVAVNVTPTDAKTVLRGVGFRGGSFTDFSPMLPFSGAPATELRGIHFPFVSPTFYPARMWTANYFGALANAGGTQLLVTPVQHRVASVVDKTSTQRKYSNLTLRLFYSGNLSQAALSDAPSIVGVNAVPDGGGIAFTAQVVGDPAAGIQQVWVTYTSDGANAWTSLDLAQCAAPLPAVCDVEDSRLWKGRLTTGPPNLKFIVQAVNGVGLVSVEDNRGAYFGLITGPPLPTVFAITAPPTSATVGDTITITGTLTTGGAPVAGKLVTISVGGTTQIGITDAAGHVTVQIPAVALTGNFQITAAFPGDENVQQSSTSVPLAVTKAVSNLAPLAPVGVTLSGVLAGTSQPLQQESVAFAVNGPGGARTIFAIADYLGRATLPPPGLPAGTYTVTGATYAGNATYASASVTLSQQFDVPKTPQSIAFVPLANKTFGDADFTVYATASSTLAVTFGASGTCTVTGSNVRLTGVGTCTITASQAGDANYDAAAPVARSFTVSPNGKAEQVIAFGPAPSNVHAGDPAVTISATSTSPTAPPSGIPIVFSSLSASVCTTGGTNGEIVALVAPGSCTIAANQAGDANYNPAPQATLVFTVLPAGLNAQFGATGSMLAARSDHTATLLLDGRVLVAGGFGANATVLGSAELYCPDNATAPPDFIVCPSTERGKFAAAAPLAVPAAGQTATRLHDGSVLLIGGANAILQWFTPSSQSWSSTAALALADRSFHTATLLADGRVFVAGGVDGGGTSLASTFIVDPSTTPWTIAQGPDLNFARESHTATLLPDGTVLIAGGRRKLPVDFAVIGDYELFDPAEAGPHGNGSLTDEGAMSRARFWHAAEIAGLNVVVAGGSCDSASAVSSALSSAELFSFGSGAQPNVACNAPPATSDLQQARRAFTLTPLRDGSLVAIGGADGAGASRNTTELFSSGSNVFQLGPSLATARAEHQSTLLLDGRVLVTGGVATGGAPLASAEVLGGAGGAGTANQPPTANAGANQTVAVGATVQLNGGASSDPEERPLAYFWTLTSKPAGSIAQLANANAVNASFVADLAGQYVAQLIVNDGAAPPLDSAPSSVQITAGAENRPPVATGDGYSVAQDATLAVGAATGVLANDSDADGNALTAVLDVTAAHGTLTLNADGSFTYAPAAGYSGPDGFTYHANDGTASSNVASVALTVVAANRPPTANAGSNQNVDASQLVQLAGSCSDADGDATTATWSFTSKPAGSTALLSNASALNPTFTADIAGSYGLQLVCNDGKVDGAPSVVTIAATNVGTMTLALVDTPVVGVGRSAAVSVSLSSPAPAGGVSVTLSADSSAILGVATSTVTIPANQTQGTATVNGVSTGTTTLRASAAGFAQATLSVAVTSNLVALGGPLSVPINGSAALPVTISQAAPAGGVVVSLTSGNAAVATLAAPTVTIPAGQTTASATVNGVALGSTTVRAQAAGYATDVAAVTVGIPATLTVENLDDSGPGSLRDAVTLANGSPGANTIVFKPGLTGTIVLTSGQIRISDALTIVGPGPQSLTIDGNASDRIFVINEANAPACPALSAPNDYQVVLAGMTLTNGRRNTDNAGGAIATLHSLTLSSVVISNSTAKSGGGLKVNLQYPGQTIAIVNSQFVNNVAKPLSAIATSDSDTGGAVAISENCDGARTEPVTVAIQNSVFSGNRVQPTDLHGLGGAIGVFSRANVVVVDSRIVDNHVDVPNPPVAGHVYRGGGIYGTAQSIHIERTEVADNDVIDVAAGAGTANDPTRAGGLGFYNDAADLQSLATPMAVTIVNSTIAGNTVTGFGGAMWVYGNVTAMLDNTTVAGNTAGASQTGGIQVTTGATDPPGAQNANTPTLTLASSIVASNGVPDITTNTATIPSFTLEANTSLIQDVCAACNITVTGSGNVMGANPVLAPLAFNGGPTRTRALLVGSPAIDAGSNPLNLTNDQRGPGFPRVTGVAADIGAFELGNHPPTANAGSDQTVSVGQLVQLNGTCTDADGDTTTPAWSITSAPAGSAASLSNVAVLNPTFTPDLAGNYVVRLVCNDTHSDSLPSSVTINTTGALISLGLVNTQLVGLGQTAQVRVALSPSAPSGGKTVTVTSDNASVLSVASPGTVNVVQGGTEAFATLNGVAVGSTTLRATAAGYASASLGVTVTANLITVGGPTSVTLNSTAQVPITLAQPAPAGGVQIAVTSSDAAIISVDTPTVTIPAGQTTTNATLRGKFPGNVTIVAAAPNYASGTSTASVGVVLDITEATVSMFRFDNRVVTIALKSGGSPAVAPPGGLSLTLSSSNSECVVAPSVTVPAGTESVTVTLTYGGTAALPCTATVTANGPPGVTQDTATVTVNAAPSLRIYYAFTETSQVYDEAIRVGAGLEACSSSNIRVEAYNPSTGQTTSVSAATAVTITSSNAAAVRVSPSDTTTVGTGSVVVTIPANSFFASICIAGLEGQAGQSATLTASATGLTTSAARAVNVVQPVVGINAIGTSLTATSADEPFNVWVGIGQSTSPTQLFRTWDARKGGGGLSVTVSVGTPSVAQLKFGAQVGSTVTATIAAGNATTTSLFLDPLAAGTTTVSATIPGFAQSIGTSFLNPQTVTIAGSALRIYYAFTETSQVYDEAIRVGAGLEACSSSNIRVEAYNPSTGQTTSVSAATAVTITSSNAAAVRVSPSDTTTVGTGSVVVTIPANSFFASICIAGLEGQAGQSATLTSSATGYNDGVRAVSVLQPVVGINGIGTSLTAASADEPFNVWVGIGQSTSPTQLFRTWDARKGGGGLSVTVSVGTPSVAQLKFGAQVGSTVAATIAAGNANNGTTPLYLDPVAAGTTTVSATIPGFAQSTAGSFVNPQTVSISP